MSAHHPIQARRRGLLPLLLLLALTFGPGAVRAAPVPAPVATVAAPAPVFAWSPWTYFSSGGFNRTTAVRVGIIGAALALLILLRKLHA
jgi:hypothetical protein